VVSGHLKRNWKDHRKALALAAAGSKQLAALLKLDCSAFMISASGRDGGPGTYST
jgi:hypothetical protein